MQKFDSMLNNFGAYHDITVSEEEREAEKAAAAGKVEEL